MIIKVLKIFIYKNRSLLSTWQLLLYHILQPGLYIRSKYEIQLKVPWITSVKDKRWVCEMVWLFFSFFHLIGNIVSFRTLLFGVIASPWESVWILRSTLSHSANIDAKINSRITEASSAFRRLRRTAGKIRYSGAWESTAS